MNTTLGETMKLLSIIFSVSFFHTAISQEKIQNGFISFIDTCEKFKKEIESTDPNIWALSSSYWKKGGEINAKTLKFAQQQSNTFKAFMEAGKCNSFILPRKEKETLSSTHSYLRYWIIFNETYVTFATVKLQQKSFSEAFYIINQLNSLSQKVAKNSTYYHLTSYYAARNRHLPTLISLIKRANEQQLQKQLQSLILQWESYPKTIPLLKQEFVTLKNETTILLDMWEKSINAKVLDKILSKQGENLSFKKMRNRTYERIKAIHNNTLKDNKILDIKKCNEVDENLMEELVKIKNGFNGNIILHNIQQIIDKKNKTTKDITQLYSLISDKITRDIVSLTFPAVSGSTPWNVRFKTKELLLINQIAARLYQFKKLTKPTTTKDFVTEKILKEELIIDPYSLKPLRLINDGDDVKVYSIYEDYNDDKGETLKKGGDLSLSPLLNE